MDNVLLESIIDINNTIAEINSEYIYESIMIESDVKQLPSSTEKVDNKSNKTMLEKAKSIWKAFGKARKKIVDTTIGFIVKNAKGIRNNVTKVHVANRTVLLETLREIDRDLESGEAFKKMTANKGRGSDSLGDYYSDKVFKAKIEIVYMSRTDAIKMCEKQLKEAQNIMNRIDKKVEDVLSYFENNKDNMSSFELINNEYKVKLVTITQETFKKLINNISNDIVRITTGKDIDEEEGEK